MKTYSSDRKQISSSPVIRVVGEGAGGREYRGTQGRFEGDIYVDDLDDAN